LSKHHSSQDDLTLRSLLRAATSVKSGPHIDYDEYVLIHGQNARLIHGEAPLTVS